MSKRSRTMALPPDEVDVARSMAAMAEAAPAPILSWAPPSAPQSYFQDFPFDMVHQIFPPIQSFAVPATGRWECRACRVTVLGPNGCPECHGTRPPFHWRQLVAHFYGVIFPLRTVSRFFRDWWDGQFKACHALHVDYTTSRCFLLLANEEYRDGGRKLINVKDALRLLKLLRPNFMPPCILRFAMFVMPENLREGRYDSKTQWASSLVDVRSDPIIHNGAGDRDRRRVGLTTGFLAALQQEERWNLDQRRFGREPPPFNVFGEHPLLWFRLHHPAARHGPHRGFLLLSLLDAGAAVFLSGSLAQLMPDTQTRDLALFFLRVVFFSVIGDIMSEHGHGTGMRWPILLFALKLHMPLCGHLRGQKKRNNEDEAEARRALDVVINEAFHLVAKSECIRRIILAGASTEAVREDDDVMFLYGISSSSSIEEDEEDDYELPARRATELHNRPPLVTAQQRSANQLFCQFVRAVEERLKEGEQLVTPKQYQVTHVVPSDMERSWMEAAVQFGDAHLKDIPIDVAALSDDRLQRLVPDLYQERLSARPASRPIKRRKIEVPVPPPLPPPPPSNVIDLTDSDDQEEEGSSPKRSRRRKPKRPLLSASPPPSPRGRSLPDFTPKSLIERIDEEWAAIDASFDL